MAKDGSLAGAFDLFTSKLLQRTDDMLPAKVIAYNRVTNRAQVQPLIVTVTTDNVQVPKAQIASVPVYQAGAGGYVISFPVQAGDLGWIKANDRDISLFLKNYSQAAPNTQRKHKFSDAVFIPDSFMKDVTINSEDDANLVIQTKDGTVRVAIWSSKVKVTAPTVEIVGGTEISFTAPQVTITASTNITLDTPLTTITGAIEGGTNPMYAQTTTFNGDITTTGDMAADGDVTADGVSLHNHTHGGVQTGGGNTGVPN
jgi:phage baseplate assembly protein gpV